MRGNPNDAQAWLAFAHRDLTWAKRDVAEHEHLRAAVSLQQAAEKCLKAKLVAMSWELERIHVLSQLLGRLQERGVDLRWFADTAEKLSYEYFAERYPGDFDPPPTEAEVRAYLVDVTRLFAELFPPDAA